MSAQTEKGLEIKVGIFVLIGLVFIAVMAMKFGRVGQGFQSFYTITVQFPNASGLIKNSDVQLAGARIGYVVDRPRIAANASSVSVPLSIVEGIKIPRKTHFQVGSSGLLGDRFVEVVPDADFDPAKWNPQDPAETWNPGETVKGTQAGGLDVLQKKGEEVFDLLKVEITKLTEVTDKINAGILSDANQKNISETFAHLKTTSEQLAGTSKNLGAVVQNAQGVLDSTQKTMGTVNSAAGDVRLAISDARKVIDAAHSLVVKAQTGDGLIATLLNNRELSENLRALVINLRTHGILFYKNRAQVGGEAAAAGAERSPPPATPAQRTSGRLQRRF